MLCAVIIPETLPKRIIKQMHNKLKVCIMKPVIASNFKFNYVHYFPAKIVNGGIKNLEYFKYAVQNVTVNILCHQKLFCDAIL